MYNFDSALCKSIHWSIMPSGTKIRAFFTIVVTFDGPTSSSDFKAHTETQAGE